LVGRVRNPCPQISNSLIAALRENFQLSREYVMQHTTPDHDINLATLPPTGDAVVVELNRLREQDPIYWSEASQCWIISGHAEVMEAFRGTLPFSNVSLPDRLAYGMPIAEKKARWPNIVRYFPPAVTNSDGAVHARQRTLYLKAVNRKLVENLRPFVRERVTALLDMAAKRDEVEFVGQIARMLPGSVALRLLGMAQDYLARLEEWDNAVTTALMTVNPKHEWLDRLETVTIDMVQVFGREIEARRTAPKEDLITQLLNAVEDGDRLSMDEMLSALILVIIAGHDSTANSITLGIRALAKHPEAWAYWRAHPEKSVDCAIELMRYVAMSTVQPRIIGADFEWQGHRLHKGDIAILSIAGGNRDPRVYAEPEKLDFTRPNDMALTFGPGLHHCIGHLLAKLQLAEFFSALVERFDRVEILDNPAFTESLVFRGLTALQLRFHSRLDT
jgi:pimeloyl-[acyl-carrier protein] synthase